MLEVYEERLSELSNVLMEAHRLDKEIKEKPVKKKEKKNA